MEIDLLFFIISEHDSHWTRKKNLNVDLFFLLRSIYLFNRSYSDSTATHSTVKTYYEYAESIHMDGHGAPFCLREEKKKNRRTTLSNVAHDDNLKVSFFSVAPVRRAIAL